MQEEAKYQLAPDGVLRAGINMSNPLLVTGKTLDGDPDGVAPDMARAIAARLSVPVKLVPFATPSQIANAAGAGSWDICLIGAEPQRAEKIDFTPAYVEIEASYMVPAGSLVQQIGDVDQAGRRIAVGGAAAPTACGSTATSDMPKLVRVGTAAEALARFTGEHLDALAGLRTGLVADAMTVPGARILDGQFMSVQQAIGTERKNAAGAAFLRAFVQEATASGRGRGIDREAPGLRA